MYVYIYLNFITLNKKMTTLPHFLLKVLMETLDSYQELP